MEPQWTKAISSESICNFFYIFFIINALITVLTGLSVIYLMFGLKMKTLATILPMLPAVAIGFAQTLFLYLLCDRAIVATRQQEVDKVQRMNDLQ